MRERLLLLRQHLQHWLSQPVALWSILPLLLVALVGGAAVGYMGEELLDGSGECRDDWESCAELEAFWQAWQLARTRFYDAERSTAANLRDGAIEGVMEALADPGHTRYEAPDEVARIDALRAGRYEGTGVVLVAGQAGLQVGAVLPNSAAAQAGVSPGDLLRSLDGQIFGASDLATASERLSSPGAAVNLELSRGAALPFTVVLTPAALQVAAVQSHLFADGIGVIHVARFGDESSSEFRAALQNLEALGMRGLILDLRGNPGGFLRELAEIGGELLPPGTTMALELQRDGTQVPFRSRGSGRASTLPTVVLINEYSASAAEILAVALREQRQIQLFGAPTVGTTTMLNSYRLANGGRLYLGTEGWLSPSGQAAQGGLAPDVAIAASPALRYPPAPAAVAAGLLNDPVLAAAHAALSE